MNNLVSVIVLIHHESVQKVNKLLDAIDAQTLPADEIIIIDTANSWHNLRSFDYLKDCPKIKIIKAEGAYPGKARNIGASFATNSIIGFLDANTYPKGNWLEESTNLLMDGNKDIVIGNTIFKAESYFQQLMRACSYGRMHYKTVPGSVLMKKIALEHQFNESVRAGEDIDWKNQVLSTYAVDSCLEPVITYNGFPKNLYQAIKKYFTYSVSAAFVEVQNNLKDLYLSLVLVFSALIIPRWNYLLPDWDKSPWYVDDVSKKYLILICAIFFLANILNRLLHSNLRLGLLSNTSIKLIIFMGLSLLIYNWNKLFAGWVESTLLYIPHITKIYILLIIMISFFMRGIYFPLKRQISPQFLFPVNWIIVGCIGLILDLIKLPGYTFGALRSIAKRSGL